MKNTKLWILDFDRCLGDVEVLYSHLERVIDTEGFISTSELKHTREEVEQSGGSFNALAVCKQQLSDEQYQNLLNAYESDTFPAGHFLLPGALHFLDWLKETTQPYMVMTYGEQDWQRIKLKRAGLHGIPYMITKDPRKGEAISGWCGRQNIELPYNEIVHGELLPLDIAEVVLVDDKAKAFNGLVSEGMCGYWLQHGSLIPSQKGDVPANVKTVKSFDDIIKTETYIA